VDWKFFVLGRDKTPLPNCSRCRDAGPEHNREACTCLTCHGFYAATTDPRRLQEMGRRHPDGEWAVRCGAASGIIVLDAEGTVDDRHNVTGVEVLDSFESWTGGLMLPATALVASTPSGGVHRYYEYVPGLRGKNRVLPGVDLKSDGGYVVFPRGRDGRAWILYGELGSLGEDVTAWLAGTRGNVGRESGGGGGSRPDTYDFQRFSREGCPGGVRDEFFNELLFRMRKAGVDRGLAVMQARAHWKRCGQPGNPLGARWYMPWHHVEYKIERVWRTVEPDNVSAELQAWATAVGSVRDAAGSVPGEDARRRDRVSRVTIARREAS
jgi:hypothetical protein